MHGEKSQRDCRPEAAKAQQCSNASGDQKTAGLRLWEVVHWSKANFYFQALAFSTIDPAVRYTVSPEH
jgi:hypothetical protein